MIRGPYPISYTGSSTGTTTTQITTGYTITNSIDVLTGATPTYEFIEKLNREWSSEKQRRLGTLRIYLNGNVIYKINNWEEVIPSLRESENQITQIWGGGTDGIQSLHTGNTQFNVYQIKYFEEPLNFVHVKHHYRTSIKPNYDIIECNEDCLDTLYGVFSNTLTTEDGYDIINENNNDIILF